MLYIKLVNLVGRRGVVSAFECRFLCAIAYYLVVVVISWFAKGCFDGCG